MRMRATCDTSKGHAQLDALLDGIENRAKPRALNTLRDQAETAGFRQIAADYDVPARTMQQYTRDTDARPGDTEASITVKGSRFPLSAFKPVQTPAGVSVVIKGKRQVVPHSFLIARFGNHVFAKGAYKGAVPRPTGETSGRFIFSRGELGRRRSSNVTTGPYYLHETSRHGLPISELFTFGPADAFGAKGTTQAMDDRVDEQAPKVLQREIAAVSRGF